MRWIASQLSGLFTRRSTPPANEADPSVFDPKAVQGGFSVRWGAPPEAGGPSRKRPGLSWTMQSAPVASRIFMVDSAQLQAARAARESRESWETISRKVNPEYDGLSPLEQDFYRRALEMAVNEDDPGSSPGTETSPREGGR